MPGHGIACLLTPPFICVQFSRPGTCSGISTAPLGGVGGIYLLCWLGACTVCRQLADCASDTHALDWGLRARRHGCSSGEMVGLGAGELGVLCFLLSVCEEKKKQ